MCTVSEVTSSVARYMHTLAFTIIIANAIVGVAKITFTKVFIELASREYRFHCLSETRVRQGQVVRKYSTEFTIVVIVIEYISYQASSLEPFVALVEVVNQGQILDCKIRISF